MAGEDAPFFLYVAYTAPHYPLHARPEYIEKYKGRFAAGWDSLRTERFRRMKRMGVLPAGAVLPPEGRAVLRLGRRAGEGVAADAYGGLRRYGRADGCGRGEIVGDLRRRGLLDNTLIVFLSDNGASNEGHLNNTVERTGKHWGDRMIPAGTRDGRPVHAGDIPGLALGPDDTYGSYGPQWAHLCGTPFRRYKSWIHEGGICAPMIVAWGGRIADRGAFRDGVFGITDFMPTFLELAGGGVSRFDPGAEDHSGRGAEFRRDVRRKPHRHDPHDVLGARGQQGRPAREMETRGRIPGQLAHAALLSDGRRVGNSTTSIRTAPRPATSRRSIPNWCANWLPSGRRGPPARRSKTGVRSAAKSGRRSLF